MQVEGARQVARYYAFNTLEDAMKRILISALALALVLMGAQPAAPQDLASSSVGVEADELRS